ncbi:MAG: DinB family protein [Phycisphaerales bacterium JB054]
MATQPPPPIHPEARAFVAESFDEAWNVGLWAAAWSKSLDGLTPEQAAATPNGARHSIWQQVLHMVYWRERALHRIETGDTADDPELHRRNWPQINDHSDDAWATARARFEATQSRVAAALRNPDPRYDVLTNILPHDCYHFGQINALRAALGLDPIE